MEITNKTKRPLKVPLGGGKKLFLGPGKTGQITPKSAQHPALAALIEAGDLEVVVSDRSKGAQASDGSGASPSSPGGTGGSSGGVRHTGDR